jgi:recombinational DNA repair protein (RecF pathway)
VFISDQGCLLRKALSGEHHFLLVLFLQENGLKYVLARKGAAKNTGACIPDLFQTGDCVIEQKDDSRPAFLKEFALRLEFKEIGRAYRALQAASSLARFYEQNLLHMEHYPDAWELLHKALRTLARKPRPEVTLFKTSFIFARSEGYPVVAHWLRQKPPAQQEAIGRVLQEPVDQAAADEAEVKSWIRDLNEFFARETDLLPVDD